MHRFRVSSVVALSAVALVVFACSDGEVAIVGTPFDAGPDATFTPDPNQGSSGNVADATTNPTDSGGDATATDSGDAALADAGDVADAADAADANDAATCANIAGHYAVTGTCTSTSFNPPSFVCARQKGCSLTAKNDFANQVLTGTATATDVTATTDAPVHEDCSGTITGGKLATFQCTAPGAGVTCTMTPSPVTVEGATDYCCDVGSQDCAAGLRCQPRAGTPDTILIATACVPDTGTVPLNGTCVRPTTAAKDFGNDNCAKGLFCANFNQTDASSRVCRALCKNNADCTGAAKACSWIGAIDAGTCVERCTLFDAASCGTGNTCRIGGTFENNTYVNDTTCDFIGAGVAGGACALNRDCAAGLTCDGTSQKCVSLCDATHACAAGTCTPFTGTNATGFGATQGRCL